MREGVLRRTAKLSSAAHPSTTHSSSLAPKERMQYSTTSCGPIESAPTSSGPRGTSPFLSLVPSVRARSEAKRSSSEGMLMVLAIERVRPPMRPVVPTTKDSAQRPPRARTTMASRSILLIDENLSSSSTTKVQLYRAKV